jgi:hypothetical protein
MFLFPAVCYGENSHYHGKDNFPYVESVPLSTQLWLKTTTAKVVIQVIKPKVIIQVLKSNLT